MTTKNIGNIGEAKILFELIHRGINVLLPFGDNCRYDLVADINNKLYRIQVKTIERINNGVITIQCFSANYHNNKKKKNIYTHDEIEWLVCYCIENDTSYILTEFKGSKTFALRIEPPKNNNKKRINFAEDYLFTNYLDTLQK